MVGASAGMQTAADRSSTVCEDNRRSRGGRWRQRRRRRLAGGVRGGVRPDRGPVCPGRAPAAGEGVAAGHAVGPRLAYLLAVGRGGRGWLPAPDAAAAGRGGLGRRRRPRRRAWLRR